MPKLTQPKKSKLSRPKEAIQAKPIGIVDAPKEVMAPTSIRFTRSEKDTVRSIQKELNKYTKRKVSESDIVRTLVSIGAKEDIETVLSSYRDNM